MFWGGEHSRRIAGLKEVENDTCSLSKIFTTNIQVKSDETEMGGGEDNIFKIQISDKMPKQ